MSVSALAIGEEAEVETEAETVEEASAETETDKTESESSVSTELNEEGTSEKAEESVPETTSETAQTETETVAAESEIVAETESVEEETGTVASEADEMQENETVEEVRVNDDASQTIKDAFPDDSFRAAVIEALNNLNNGTTYDDTSNVPDEIKNITAIEKTNSNITDITGIDLLTGLKTLNLSNNSITNITGIGSLTSLETLDLSDNKINISSTETISWNKLNSLKSVDLSYNELTNVLDFSKNDSLETLKLDDNCLTEAVLTDIKQKLPKDRKQLKSDYDDTYYNNDFDKTLSSQRIIDIKTAFSDENFREIVKQALEANNITVTDNVNLRELDFKGIKEIKNSITSYDKYNSGETVKDIKGIEYLTELVTLELQNHQISDISSISWNKLKKLKTIDLSGNEIKTAVGDQSKSFKNTAVTTLILNDNLLTQTEYNKILSTIPNNCVLPDDTFHSQRLNGFQLTLQSTYYLSGVDNDECYPIIMLSGYKSEMPYTDLTFKIDNIEYEFQNLNDDGTYIYGSKYIYSSVESISKTGEHPIEVSITQNGIVSTATGTITIEDEPCYAEKSSYRFSTNSEDDIVNIYYPPIDANINSIVFIDEEGTEFLYQNVSISNNYTDTDYRYTDIKGGKGIRVKDRYMKCASFSLSNSKNELPNAKYSLRVIADDTHTYQLDNLITISGSTVVNSWDYTVTASWDKKNLHVTELYYNDVNRNTAEITLTNRKDTDRVDIKVYYAGVEDTSGSKVKIEQDSDNRNNYIVTANPNVSFAADEEPVVEISIQVGTSIKKFNMTLLKREYATGMAFYDGDNEVTKDSEPIQIKGPNEKKDIKIKITPQESLNIRDDVEITSSDTKVAVISKQTKTDDGILLSVETRGLGETTLTAIIKDDDNKRDEIKAECNVKVTIGSFNDRQKEVKKRNAGVMYAVTNITGNKLGNVKLPDGWTWVDPDIEIEASDDDGLVNYYDAVYTEEGYMPFTAALPVCVTEITGITISGDEELTSGHDGNYKINLQYKGYKIESNTEFVENVDKAVVYEWSADSILKAKEINKRKASYVAGATDSVTEGMVYAQVTVGEDIFKEDFIVRVLTEHIVDIVIKPNDAKNINYKYIEEENVVYIDEGEVADNIKDNKRNILYLTAEAYTDDKEAEIEKGTLKWTVNDESIAQIIERTDGMAQINILDSGTIIVRATANDVGKKYAELAIEVRDFTPIVETTDYTISKYSSDGIVLPIYAVEGNPITKVVIEDENFRVDKVNGKFVLFIKDSSQYVTDTVVDTVMTVRTQMGSNAEENIKITVDTSNPKVAFRQITVPNVFYADTVGEYRVVSDNTVLMIEDADKDKTEGFTVTGYDKKTGILTVGAKALNSSTVADYKNKNSDVCKLRLLITYDGYYGTHTEEIKVVTKNKKPSYKINAINTVNGINNLSTYIYDLSTKKNVVLPQNVVASSLTDDVDVTTSKGMLSVNYLGEKSKNYKVELTSDTWTDKLTLSGKITVAKELSTELDMSTVTLNMAHNITQNGTISITASAKNSLINVTGVTWQAANKNAQKLLDSGYLDISKSGDNKISLGLNETKPSDVKAGSYSFKIYGETTVGDRTMLFKAANLKVVLAAESKNPTVKLKTKGKINLVDRANTSIVCSPSVLNMTANIASIEAAGQYKDYFDVAYDADNGKIEVKAISGIKMRTDKVYRLGIKVNFDNNTDYTAYLNVKPVSKAPKLKSSASSKTIYKVSCNEVTWNILNVSDYGQIEGIDVVDNKAGKNFVLTQTSDNQITASINPSVKRTIKPGKYTVSYGVRFADQGSNAKSVMLKMVIVVK
jgi:Leucine-rich repeat (LRR) protein